MAEGTQGPDFWIHRAAQEFPGAVALQGESALTFSGLAADARRLAGRISAVPDAPRVLALQGDSSWTVARFVYACALAGVAVMPLDPAMPQARRNRLLDRAGCRWLVAGQRPQGLPPEVRFDSASGLPDGARDGAPVTGAVPGESPLCVIATSGSEGDPKGVMLGRENIVASVQASRLRLGLERGDVWLDCLPLFHIGGLSILYRCLDAGARVRLHQGFDAARVWADLDGVTHISLVPAMLARLLDAASDAPPPPGLRVVLVGGAALSPGLARRAHRAGWPVCVSYGMSETASQFATDCGPDAGLERGGVGRPLEGCRVRLAGDGRLEVKGGGVMAGYVNPRLQPGDGLRDGWFRTADRGRIEADGRLVIEGRADQVLVSAGRNIHPAESEELLMACPGVEDLAVTGQADEVWGECLVALYCGSIPPEELERWAREGLPSHLRPRRFLQVPSLPRNTMGKVDRSALLALLEGLS
jgi:O-succinylbenzoic acid--CoA ligase